MAGTYENPSWNNNASPALDETNMNNLSDAVVQNQTDIAALNTMLSDYPDVKSRANQVPTLASKVNVSGPFSISTWKSAGTTYQTLGYPYYGEISATGAAASSFVYVALSPADAVSGSIAPFVTISSGKVRVYSKINSATVTVDKAVVINP